MNRHMRWSRARVSSTRAGGLGVSQTTAERARARVYQRRRWYTHESNECTLLAVAVPAKTASLNASLSTGDEPTEHTLV